MKFWFFAVFLPGAFAFTEALMDREPSLEHGEVLIKSISSDGPRVIVSTLQLEPEGSHKETLELCPALVHIENDNPESDPVAMLQEAFATGRLIQLDYRGRFNRCISAVHLVSRSQ